MGQYKWSSRLRIRKLCSFQVWLEILRVIYSIVRGGIKFIFEWDPKDLWRISHYIFWRSKIWPNPNLSLAVPPKLITNVVTRQYSLDSGRHSIQGNTRSCTTLHCLATPRTTEMGTGRSGIWWRVSPMEHVLWTPRYFKFALILSRPQSRNSRFRSPKSRSTLVVIFYLIENWVRYLIRMRGSSNEVINNNPLINSISRENTIWAYLGPTSRKAHDQ